MYFPKNKIDRCEKKNEKITVCIVYCNLYDIIMKNTYAQNIFDETKAFIANCKRHEIEVYTNNCKQYVADMCLMIQKTLDKVSHGEQQYGMCVEWDFDAAVVKIAIRNLKSALTCGVNYYGGLITFDEIGILNNIMSQELEKLGFEIQQNDIYDCGIGIRSPQQTVHWRVNSNRYLVLKIKQ